MATSAMLVPQNNTLKKKKPKHCNLSVDNINSDITFRQFYCVLPHPSFTFLHCQHLTCTFLYHFRLKKSRLCRLVYLGTCKVFSFEAKKL